MLWMAQTRLKSSIILGLLVILIGGSDSFSWEDEDSVIVEALRKDDWNSGIARNYRGRWPWMETRSRSDASGELPCYTSSGEQGFCSDIRQCYPSVFTDIPENQENQGMVETLKSMSGPCDPSHFSNFRIDLPDGLICCVNRPPMEIPNTQKTSTTTTGKPIPVENSAPGKLPSIPDAVAAYLHDQRQPTCGYLNNSLPIDTEGKRFPWIVALVGGHGHFCAGSLIDRYHVLTGAQCVNRLTSEEIGNMRVFLGDYKLHTTSDGPAIIRKVSRVIYHRGFSRQTLRNDIALMKLSLPAPIGTPKVLPICLPSERERVNEVDYFGARATLAGWGRSWNPSPTPVLRTTQMTIWSNQDCRIKYGYLAKDGIAESMMCAATEDKGRSEVSDCIADSGGPLVITGEDGISHQVGVVSWNIGCGNYPYVYTRVSKFIPWIEKNMLRR